MFSTLYHNYVNLIIYLFLLLAMGVFDSFSNDLRQMQHFENCDYRVSRKILTILYGWVIAIFLGYPFSKTTLILIIAFYIGDCAQYRYCRSPKIASITNQDRGTTLDQSFFDLVMSGLFLTLPYLSLFLIIPKVIYVLVAFVVAMPLSMAASIFVHKDELHYCSKDHEYFRGWITGAIIIILVHL